jgi:hypothetical protein
MNEPDAEEAAGIVQRAMKQLIAFVPPSGRPGADARRAIGDLINSAHKNLRAGTIAPPLDICFMLAQEAGVNLYQTEALRRRTQQEHPRTIGATLIRDSIILLCLATSGRTITRMTFISREDVDRIRASVQPPFNYSEEVAADSMDQAGYRAIVGLHAAIVNHLAATALPLPRMLNYRFAAPLPTLVVAYKLYQDARRSDEVRHGNKVIHPAFTSPYGIALSR